MKGWTSLLLTRKNTKNVKLETISFFTLPRCLSGKGLSQLWSPAGSTDWYWWQWSVCAEKFCHQCKIYIVPDKAVALAPMTSTYSNRIHSHAHLRDKIEGFVKNNFIDKDLEKAGPSIYDFLIFLNRSSRDPWTKYTGYFLSPHFSCERDFHFLKNFVSPHFSSHWLEANCGERKSPV